MITTLDLCLRPVSAVVIGGLVGINREMQAKAVGVRTLGLVGLGSALGAQVCPSVTRWSIALAAGGQTLVNAGGEAHISPTR